MTTRRLTLMLAAATTLATLAGTAQAGGAQVGVTVGNAPFPDRALVLTLPHSTQLGTSGVQVRENGQPVGAISLTAGKQNGTSIGFVLAIDESASMQGRPLTDALRAARAFAAQRQPEQALGLITFNSTSTTVLRPTTDAGSIASALATPAHVAVGTRLWGAVARAVNLLHGSGVEAGSVVVLSDGRDTRSTLTALAVARYAHAAGVRVFTIGLRSAQFDPASLRTVAEVTGGTYAETTSHGLVAVYAALAQRLANEYVLRYRSAAPRGTTVHVTVAVPAFGRDAGAAAATYFAPLPANGGVLHHSAWQRFWVSWWSAALTVLVAALLTAGAVRIGLRAARRRPLVRRLGAYVELDGDDREAAQADNVHDAVDRSLHRLHGWDAFEQDLDVGRVRASASRLALAAGAAAAAIVVVALGAGFAPAALLAIVPLLAVRIYPAHRAAVVRREFEEQLPDTVQVLASALRAGHGLSGAIHVAIEDSSEPTRSELERALAEERLGMPLDEALSIVAKKMQSTELDHVAFVAAIHRQTGGNTAEVLDRVHDAIRERFELRRTIHTLTAQARMTRWILTLLPVVLGLAITALNMEYMRPLFETGIGRALLAIAVAMVIAGFFLIKRLTEIKV